MIKILLVEDDAWLADMEQAMLSEEGYEVVVAPNALVAIDSIDMAVPDVIILDVLLAGSTAFSLLNELQSHVDTSTIPIILCTNLAEQFTSSQLKGYGVKRIVDKTTMHPQDLIVAVRALLADEERDEDISN